MTDIAKRYPNYKPTGIDWLGELPSHWTLRRMKHGFDERVEKGYPNEPLLAATQNHGVVTKDRYENRTVVAENGLELLKLVVPGDFVISLRSFQGGIELAYNRGIISPAYTVLKPEADTDPGYHKHLMKSFRFIELLQQHVTGIRQGQNIDYVKLGRSHIPLPPLDEQRAITDYLDRKDAEITRFIESRRRMIALLEEKKQAIINQAVTKGLDPAIPMKDSGVEWLGEIPAHWEVRPLKRLAEVSPSIPLDRNTDQRQRVPFLPMESLGTDGTMSFDQLRPIVDVASGFPRFQPDDFLLAKITPCFENGKSGLVPHMPGPVGFGSTEYHVIRFNTSQIRLEFASHILRSKWFRSVGEEHMIGSAGQKRVPTDFLKSFTFPLPPLEDQYDIANHLNRIAQLVEQRKSRMEREIALMQEYRTRLISDVVTGKVKVG